MSGEIHVTEAAGGFLPRLEAARRRLEAHAGQGPPAGLTDPDPGGEERWEAGQVWAHLAEFPGYWHGQITALLERRAAGEQEPIPFGRTRTDPKRIEAIERGRHLDPRALVIDAMDAIAAVEDDLRTLPADAWRATGLHPTRGEMALGEIVERFIVSHLEEHADQLDLLRRRSP